MGYKKSLEIVELEQEGYFNRETAIKFHLESNHYPPVPEVMVAPCIEAIDAYNAEETDGVITLPKGVTYRGMATAPVLSLIKNYNLEAWLKADVF